MNRSELIENVAARAGSDQAAARRHVDAVFDAIMESVASGERVLVTGFGTFDRFARPARQGRNPRTGSPIEVAAADVPRFRVGQTFKNRVAGGNSATAIAETPAVAAPVETPKAKKSKKAEPKKKDKKAAKAADAAPAKKKGKAKPVKAVKAAKTAKAKKAGK
ncbi:HU family DNA-binding protein [Actinomadura barringtoniae]|uniref:HU family DNA-binding protein n=1 Tax=Actinomadura barringtoniae TaxID=1427535 RepID=A0A939PAI1_9ACTN|nr:HU family DNA-binding protein [Actinomadura barringtoniae]